MGAGLSFAISQAGADSPKATGLLVDGRAIAFADLAARARELTPALASHDPSAPHALVCRPYLPALLELYACLDLGIPVALISPKVLPEREKALRRLIAGFRPTSGTNPTAALAIVFTSGSSGEPKGVELSRGAFEAAATASTANLGWRDDDRWLLGLSFAHVGGLSILLRCLAARRPAVVISAKHFSAREVAHAIERDRVTLLSLVPTQLRQLLDLAPAWRPPLHLRAVLLGGAAATPTLIAEGRDRGWPLLATYGMTETCAQIATQPLSDLEHPPVSATIGAALVTAPLLPGFEVRIVEEAIQVRSPTLLTRYQPIGAHPDPRTADGWLVTQDVGRFDSERLEVLGRRDDVIVTGGEKVMPIEVEQVVASCAGVRAAAVFGMPDPVWGQIVAVALVATEAFDLTALRERLLEKLLSHQRPRRVMLLPELPLTGAGKVDRRGLAKLKPAEMTPLQFS